MMIDQLVIIIYLLIILGVGIYFAKKQRTEESFFLANRNLGTFHVTATIFSTIAGAGTLFMVASMSYTYGFSFMWFFIAAIIGFFIYSFAAPRIKKIADENNCITLPELLKVKLDRKCMIISSLITIILYGGFVALNFLAAGNVLRLVFDVPLILTVLIFAFIVVFYSLLGGFKAIVWTDIVQMFVILFGISLLLVLAMNAAGGPGAIGNLPETHKDPMSMGWVLISGLFLSTILSYFGSQDIYQRIFAAKSQGTAKNSVLLMGGLLVVLGIITLFLSSFGKILFPDILADQILPVMTTSLVPVGLIGFVLAAYLAMANSTADSELLTVTSNIMMDFFGRGKKLTSRQEVMASRIILIFVAIIAIIFALTVRSMANIVLSLYTWLGILGMVVIATLFWKRTTANAVFWSLIIGFISAIIYVIFTGDFETAMLVGLVPALIVLVGVSLLSRKG